MNDYSKITALYSRLSVGDGDGGTVNICPPPCFSFFICPIKSSFPFIPLYSYFSFKDTLI